MDEHRIQFVVGKGGVGKSVLTAGLALEAAGAGHRVLALELGGPGGLARLFGRGPNSSGETSCVEAGVHLGFVEGESALAEYLGMIIPIRRLLNTVFESRLYRAFVGAAPGLRELMTMGKVWYEADRRRPDGQYEWDRIFVDVGASGHALQYLAMPAVAASTFTSGLVHRESSRVLSLLRDSATTRVHVVAIAEEMPLAEAREILSKLRDDLRLPVGCLVLNRCLSSAPSDIDAALVALSELAPEDPEAAGLCRAMAKLAAETVETCRRQELAIARIVEDTGLPLVRLPRLAVEEFGLEHVRLLAAHLKPDLVVSPHRGRGESGTGEDPSAGLGGVS